MVSPGDAPALKVQRHGKFDTGHINNVQDKVPELTFLPWPDGLILIVASYHSYFHTSGEGVGGRRRRGKKVTASQSASNQPTKSKTFQYDAFSADHV